MPLAPTLPKQPLHPAPITTRPPKYPSSLRVMPLALTPPNQPLHPTPLTTHPQIAP
jgi:hypothetical protein